MTRSFHFGVTLPQIKRTWEEARDAAACFDELGFDSVWVCDHLFGVPFPNLPIFEAWSELAAIAATTHDVELGTLVTPPLFRNAAVLAKQIATIDHVSGGRTICGLGAGWMSAEFESHGLPFPGVRERLRALDETADALVRLWTEPSTTFDGAYVHMQDAYCEPKPIRRPPILIGGGGEKVLLEIAARRADIWNNMGVFQGELARKIELLRRHCDAIGRDHAEIRISQQALVVIAETEAQARESLQKAQRIYGGHMGGGLEEHGIWGHPARVVERIENLRKMGCTMLVMELFGRDSREPARLFAEQVLPHFGA
jgi:probable F420-dependent oxidoreductase